MTEGPRVYFCPTAGEVEQHPGGGFDVCCDHPELHRPITWSVLFGICPDYTGDACTADWLNWSRGVTEPAEYEHAACWTLLNTSEASND